VCIVGAAMAAIGPGDPPTWTAAIIPPTPRLGKTRI